MRLVVFDCDGTLVDSQHSIVSTMGKAFAGAGLEPPLPEAVRRVVGLSLEEAVARLLPEADRSSTLVGELAESYRGHFHELPRERGPSEPLYPGCKDALRALRRRDLMLGVATGKGRRGLDATLASHGLAESFVTLQTADVAPSKPHPEMLYRAMAETGAEPEETVLVGDTIYDMDMARNAGVGAIGVAWGYHGPDDLAASGALTVLESFADLLPTLLELEGTRP